MQNTNDNIPSNIGEQPMPANDNDVENLTEKAKARRNLLKMMVASSVGLGAAAFVPEKWAKPIVNGGVLPAHAQTSPTPTATATPTATPIIYAITTCNAQNASGDTSITPIDTISTFAIITPTDAGIELRRRIILNQAGHTLDGQDLDNVTGVTDVDGQFTPANFDLSSVQGITSGTDRIAVRWEFVNSADGTNVCINLLTLVDQPN